MRTRKRLLSLLLCGAILFSLCSPTAFAEAQMIQDSGQITAGAGGLCEHHTKHNEDCGYTKGEPGTPCTHQHTDECYIEVTNCVHEHGESCYLETKSSVSGNNATPSNAEEREPKNCEHICSEESGCITEKLNCQHEHDSDCGYSPAAEGTPCGYVCEICSAEDVTPSDEAAMTVEQVQGLIDALSTAEELSGMSEEKQNEVYNTLQAAYDAYETLTDEQKKEITGAEIFESLFAFFNGMVNLLEVQEVPIEDGPVTITDCGSNCSGHTITGTGTSTGNTITVTGGTHDITLQDVNIDVSTQRGAAAFSISTSISGGSEVYLTLNGVNTLQSGWDRAGLEVPGGTALVITKNSTGSLDATGGTYGAGIGGGYNNAGGTITINGGTVTATGDSRAAGIGGGNFGAGGTITITGGVVDVSGGTYGAGIGGGQEGGGGTITITGGTVTATGGTWGAGIGGGCGSYYGGSAGDGGEITITGGAVDATGGTYGSGIGGGSKGAGGTITITGGTVDATGGTDGAGIGGGERAAGGTVIISGGTVTAASDTGAGIGAGNTFGGSVDNGTFAADGNAFIVASSIGDNDNTNDWNGVIFEGDAGQVYGDSVTLTIDAEAPEGKTLTIRDDQTLTVGDGVTLTNKGTITNNGTINNKGIITVEPGGKLEGEVTGGIVNLPSSDADVKSVSVDGITGSIDGTTITVTLPYGTPLPTDPTQITITLADTNATVSNLGTADNGATWTFTVTAHDTIATQNYTIKVSIAPDPAAGNKKDVAAAKTAIQAQTWAVGQATANTETSVKTWIEDQLATMAKDLNGVVCTVSMTDFTAATAGNSTNENGANGSFTFTVSLSKGDKTGDIATSTYADDMVTGINGTITATPYQAKSYMVSVTASPAEGGTVSGGGTYTENASVTVTATAKNDYHFVKWMEGGTEVSKDTSYNFIITGNRTLVAVFEKDGGTTPPQPTKYTVTVQNDGNGTASASLTSAEQGKKITLTTKANSGYQFKEWQVVSGNVTISNNSFTMPAENVTVKAIFEKDGGTTPPPTEYTVTFDGNGGTSPEAQITKNGKLTSLPVSTRSGYSFNGWYTARTGGDKVTLDTVFTASVTVYAQWTKNSDDNSGGGGNSGNNSGGGSSSGSGGGSTIVERPDPVKPEIPTTSQTKPVTPDKNGGVAVDNGAVQSAINTAKDDAKKNGNTANGVAVVIPITPQVGQTSFNVTINAQTLNLLVREKVKRLEINIDGVIVEAMDASLLAFLNTSSANRDIVFRVKQTDPSVSSKEAKAAIGTRPAYDLSLAYLSGGKETPITDLDGCTISVRLPYTPAKEEQTGNLYAVYVDSKGKVEWLTKSSYDPDLGGVIFETGHFSIYGIGYKNPVPAFTDIKGHWAEDNIIFVASRGLLTGTGNNQFSPNTGMTRGMFVTALGRLADIDPADYKTGKFTDVKADAYYAPYVNWAAEKGIVNGTTATTFSPDTNITREQMAVIMAGYAKKLGYELPAAHDAVTFADNAQISSWAAKEVKAMQQAGIMAGKGGNRFDPKGTATRAEVATVLRRFVEIVIDPQTAQGWMQNHSGSWQYMKNGKLVTGWLQDDKKWYWLDNNGWMFAGGWKQIGGKWYYFYADGSMAVSTKVDGYEVGADGERITQ